MNSNKSVMHISIYYQGSSKSKTELKKQLTLFTERISTNPWESSIDICLDTFEEQGENQILQELTYDTVITCHTKQPLTINQELYTFVVLLISLTMQRLYENSQKPKPEDWMLISITPSNADNPGNSDYDIQWSIGQ